MSGLQITITTAGYAALINAQNLGTNPTLVTQIGITEQAFIENAGMTTLPGELKRLTTFAGSAVADDTVHVTIRDDGPDTYSMRGFGLYLADGTLLAIYGQLETILEKSAQAMLLLATDIRFIDINATDLVFGDTNWINPPATTEVQGVLELATPNETIAGTDDRRGTTPAGLKVALDSRFGSDAPSAYIKDLLSLPTAALMRTAIGLGSAATRNEGAGNNLDADTLDGQHGAYYRAWGNLTGKPSTFAPAAHKHSWADISSGIPSTASRWPSWTEVSGKPSTFNPGQHGHAWSDISSGIPSTASRWPAWDEVISKPLTFPPAAHAHAWSQLEGTPGVYRTSGIVDFYFRHGTNDIGGIFGDANRTVMWTNAGGYVSLRPEGRGSVAGELKVTADTLAWMGLQVDSAGNLVANRGEFSGNVRGPAFYGGSFRSSAGSADLSAEGSGGGVRLMPNGHTTTGMMEVLGNGDVMISGVARASLFRPTSSRKTKRDIQPMRYGLAEVLRLTAVTWLPLESEDDDPRRGGLVAEDTAVVIPVAVDMESDIPGIDYAPIVAALVRAVQELSGEVRALKRHTRMSKA